MASAIYNALFRRNFTMLGVVFAGAFAFQLGYDSLMNKIWDHHNRGVRSFSLQPVSGSYTDGMVQRQWKDIRHKYIEGGDDE
ncbi:hypothetical protein VTH06DRAFT_786 [Thermothelomyces fergusii]